MNCIKLYVTENPDELYQTFYLTDNPDISSKNLHTTQVIVDFSLAFVFIVMGTFSIAALLL